MSRAAVLSDAATTMEQVAGNASVPAETIVRVDHLRKTYGRVVAVDDISFDVRQGEIFGIVGPNGAGKTTTIECLEGHRRPDTGSVRVFGVDPLNDRRLRERLGVQLQRASLPRRIKVWEAVDLFASFYRRSVDQAALLEQLGLAEKRNDVVTKLSGGQVQRLFIALALVNDPELLFLDELSTGLDPQARHRVWDMVRSMRTRGKTIVLTTHLMEEAERLCDRVAIIDRGRILALDTPAGLIRAARLSSRLLFVSDAPVNAAVLAALPGVTRAERIGDQIIVHGSDAMASQVLRVLDQAGWSYRDLRTERASLEDVFLALTGRALRE